MLLELLVYKFAQTWLVHLAELSFDPSVSLLRIKTYPSQKAMESVGFMWKVSVLMSMLLFAGCTWRAEAQLSAGFYSKSCPKAFSIVRAGVRAAVSKEKRMAASLLRLHFHDCFVNGCDASILLDDNATFTGEKTAGPNVNSARGFEVIDDIKSKLESQCPSTVSCADILAIAARDSVVALGGPSWTVLLGRRDSTTGSLSGANSNLPSPSSSKSTLVSMFAAQGLSEKDMVALSGSHTIGQARCVTFRGRIYNDSDIDAAVANSLKGSCPASAGSGDSNLAPLDAKSPNAFDNAYYRNLQSKRGTLHSDQQIADNPLVKTYSKNNAAFFRDFESAMLRMGNISPLTGSQGQIRTNCRVVNPS